MQDKLSDSSYWWIRLCYLEESEPELLEQLLFAGGLKDDLDRTTTDAIKKMVELSNKGLSEDDSESLILSEIVTPNIPASHDAQSRKLTPEAENLLRQFKNIEAGNA